MYILHLVRVAAVVFFQHVLTLEMQFFDVEWSYDCSVDYLDVYDGTGDTALRLGRYCNAALPPDTLQVNIIHYKYKTSLSTT